MAGYRDEREKPTTQITVPSKDLIQIWRRNQKLYRQAKAEGIQHHQTSSSTNAKGFPLDRKYRNLNPKQQSGNWIILINNYFKCKLVECPNQKTKTGWMDIKTRPLYMLPIRDPPQNKWHIQTEGEGLEKDISCKWRTKESRNSKTPIRQNRLWK